MENTSVQEGKTIAIISYITFIGLIIAFLMNSSKKNSFATFHIRQSLGIVVLSLIFSLITYVIHIPLLSLIFNGIILVLIILGIISAAGGEQKPLPIVGDYFSDWFKNVG